MIKIHGWTDAQFPQLILKENGDFQFYDYPTMYNFDVDDQIQHKTATGIRVYVIVEVQPANLKDFPPEMRLVTARSK